MPAAPQQYQVERIVGARRTKSSAVRSRKDSKPKEEFRVRWKGWPPASDTWEDGAQLRREVPHAVKFYEYLVREAAVRHRQQASARRAKRKQMRRRAEPASVPQPRCQRASWRRSSGSSGSAPPRRGPR
jgi:hypothetical protein